MTLIKPTPALTANDSANLGATDFFLLGYAVFAVSLFVIPLTNSPDITLGQLGSTAVFATVMLAEYLLLVAHIFYVRHIFQVAKLIVGWVSILVVNLKSIWALAEERLGNKIGNTASDATISIVKTNFRAPRYIGRLLEKSPAELASSRVYSIKAFDSAQVANAIGAFIAANVAPFFIGKIHNRFNGLSLTSSTDGISAEKTVCIWRKGIKGPFLAALTAFFSFHRQSSYGVGY